MKPIAMGDTLPDIQVMTTGNQMMNLADLKGQPVILYFYPKDNTPGCTQEGNDFRALYSKFVEKSAVILGVSRDDLAAHKHFKDKQCFPFELISDQDEILCQLFDVLIPKNMFGKLIRGIQRSTFLFDKKGELRQAWRKVTVKDHAAQVLAAVESL